MRHTHHRPSPRLLALLLAAGCASHSAPLPPLDDGGGSAGRPVAVVCGRGNSQGEARSIGRNGGRVSVGSHSLTVPRDAVSAPTEFTIMEVGSGTIRVELGPDGTRFDRNATLTLSFARCGGLPHGFKDLQILQVDGNDSVIAALSSTVDLRARTVSAPLQHLSGYLIGGNRDGGT